MRGKPGQTRRHGRPAGNIPAYAGKTRSLRLQSSTSEEHPRVCGENSADTALLHSPPGTSPRMRGKRLLNRPLPAPQGNIPAYAGKTTSEFTVVKSEEEHPRVCGENSPGQWIKKTMSGTSPRMRGKRIESEKRFSRDRNIPAYAGKTKKQVDGFPHK